MAIKVYKPTTPGRRAKASVLSSSDLTKKNPEKKLTRALKSKAGRSRGKITVRHRGGGAKRRYRVIDFKLQNFDQPATVKAIEYDPNRNARIALIEYATGSDPAARRSYIVAPETMQPGDTILSSQKKIEPKVGNRMPLEFIPAGMGVYNIELRPGQGSQIVRAAGTLAIIQTVEGKYAQLKLPSGEIRLVPKQAQATIGQVSNIDHRLVRLGKAGRSRHQGIRPSVRGKAMNPVDHPHGGGEGGNPIGMKFPKTKWGKPAMGVKSRKRHKPSNKFIVKRRKK